MPPEAPTRVIEKEMALTHAEFFRLLARAVGTETYEVVDGAIRVDGGAGRIVEIVLGPETPRRIALLEIPSTRVQISLSGFPGAEAAAWLGRFERTYQRGGG